MSEFSKKKIGILIKKLLTMLNVMHVEQTVSKKQGKFSSRCSNEQFEPIFGLVILSNSLIFLDGNVRFVIREITATSVSQT